MNICCRFHRCEQKNKQPQQQNSHERQQYITGLQENREKMRQRGSRNVAENKIEHSRGDRV